MTTVYDLIKKHEGFRGIPYDCATGEPLKAAMGSITIGYGRNLEANPITPTEAHEWLHRQVQILHTQITAGFPPFTLLDEARQYVLIDIAYNVGVAGLLAFRKMLAHVKDFRYDLAADEMLASRWASQVPTRAQHLAQIMRTGVLE